MKDSSNNAVILIILAVALSAVFAVMHFTSPSSTSVQLLSGTKGGSSKGINLNASDGANMYSDNLSGFKARSNSGSDGATTSGINLPTSMTAPAATIAQTDVQTVPQKQVARTSASAVSIYTQTQSKTFKTANVDNQALQQNVPKSDINATIKARTAEVAPKTTKKGSVPTDKKGPQKSDLNGGPGGQPGMGSLPIGDGTWALLLMISMYATRKMMNKSFMPSMD